MFAGSTKRMPRSGECRRVDENVLKVQDIAAKLREKFREVDDIFAILREIFAKRREILSNVDENLPNVDESLPNVDESLPSMSWRAAFRALRRRLCRTPPLPNRWKRADTHRWLAEP